MSHVSSVWGRSFRGPSALPPKPWPGFGLGDVALIGVRPVFPLVVSSFALATLCDPESVALIGVFLVTRIVAPGSEKRPLMDVWSAASVTLIGIDCRSFREAPLTGRVVGCHLWSLPVAIFGFDSACFMIGGERRGQGDQRARFLMQAVFS